MPLMQEKLYRAFIAVGAGDDVAREAAVEAVETHDRLAKVESELRVLRWICSVTAAMVTGLFLKAFT
jgi:hypothetical protein